MYYEFKGYNALKQVSSKYTDIAYNKSKKNVLIKQYKEYLKNNDLDMFKVVSYRNSGDLKDIITYQ